jgi:deoxyribodipyrimidine photo-lyase
MSKAFVLLHRNLRFNDHRALAMACENHDKVVPTFVFDPSFYEGDGLACDARLRFLHECLQNLDITLFCGNPVEMAQHVSGEVYTLHEPTSRYGKRRNDDLREAGVTFVDGDPLRRDVSNTRDGWSDAVEEFLESEPYTVDETKLAAVESDVSVSEIEERFNVEPEKTNVPTGGRDAALDQLEAFVSEPEYWGNISEPTRERGVSDLSTYLRFGCLSVREVYQTAQNRLSGRHLSAFTSRLYWNLHYSQKLLDWSGWMNKALNPALREMGTFDQNRWERMKSGETGYPMIDAAVRQLTKTGWLNFRNRAMLASFHSDLLNLPWKLGADWMYYHLIDADPAINYTQWQCQSSRVGVNMYRIYNPIKQVQDSDEAGDWIREWVPELFAFPKTYLHQPEKAPLSVQERVGVDVGRDYPRPVVEYEAARIRARNRYESREPDAKRELQSPTIRKRASFSGRGRKPQSVTKESNDSQKSLSEF